MDSPRVRSEFWQNRHEIDLPEGRAITICETDGALTGRQLVVQQWGARSPEGSRAGGEVTLGEREQALAAEVWRLAKAPAPFHYVTENLPEPNTTVIFWVVSEIAHLGPSNEEGGFDHGEAKSAPGWGWRNLSGEPFRCGTAPGEVFAWQPLPAAPPLPEDGR